MAVGALRIEDVATATGGRPTTAPARRDLTGVSIDSRTVRPGEVFFAIAGPRFDGHDFLSAAAAAGAAAAVVHREVAAPPGLGLVRVGDTTTALSDLARHVRATADVPVVAITGSAGKTTTKEMAAALLATRGPVLKTEGNLNNQYGLPLSLLRLAPEHTAAVLELGMSGAGELRALTGLARPDVAVITMVAPVHLEFFDSVAGIAAAKAEILEGLGPGGAAVLNADDPLVRQIGEGRIGKAHRGRVIWFGRDRRYDVSAENWRGTIQGMRFDLRLGGEIVEVALPLPGPHFLSNFLAAAAVAHHLRIGPDAIARAALEMKPARHRGEVLALGEGITLVDDCYNANPAAVEAAVTALTLAPGRRVAFLGDMLELGPSGPELHRQTGERVAAGLQALVAAGPLAAHFVEGARRGGMKDEALASFPDSAAAAAAAPRLVRPGDAVLVKGSRGARMEAVVDALRAAFPPAGGSGGRGAAPRPDGERGSDSRGAKDER
jgi:UDP-N-acetylmuramoyl-tripeptide--D-alanyl-D-alanine ligase